MLRSRRGFTLIELVIVIVILGILAAVAIPRYVDLSSKAREASTKGCLGGLRAAIAVFYASKAVYETARYPSSQGELEDSLVEGRIPDNPYDDDSTANNIVLTDQSIGTVASGGGWAYSSASGRIWANTSTVSENTW